MNRFLSLFATALALGGAASAQTVSNTYSSTDAYGNTVTTTVQGPASAVAQIANQSIYGGYAGYGVPNYGSPYSQPYGNYNYNFNYSDNYANNGYGYAGGQAYFVPGYNTPIGQANFGWDQPPVITSFPQTIITPPVVGYPYGILPGYGATYGYNNAPVPCPPQSYGPRRHREEFGSRTAPVATFRPRPPIVYKNYAQDGTPIPSEQGERSRNR